MSTRREFITLLGVLCPLTRMPDEEIIYRFQLRASCRLGLTPRP